jgi:hypothetical protein
MRDKGIPKGYYSTASKRLVARESRGIRVIQRVIQGDVLPIKTARACF